jgi:hypothetical protein
MATDTATAAVRTTTTASVPDDPVGPAGTTGLQRVVSSGHEDPLAPTDVAEINSVHPVPVTALEVNGASTDTSASITAPMHSTNRSHLLISSGYRSKESGADHRTHIVRQRRPGKGAALAPSGRPASSQTE